MEPALATLGPGVTVEDYLEQWLAFARGRVKPKVHQGYETLLRCHPMRVFGEMRLDELHALHLQQLYGDLLEGRGWKRPLSTGTVRNIHLVLSNALAQAQRWGLVPSNPAAAAQPPRPRRAEAIVVDAALARQLLSMTKGSPLGLPVALALGTGMRRGEICALRWGDLSEGLSAAHVSRAVQPSRGRLYFQEPKTRRSRRTVVLPPFLTRLLHKHRSEQATRREQLAEKWVEQDLVVERGDGSTVDPDSLSSLWLRFVKRSSLPHVRFHDLRHAHATLMLLEGVHPKVVSERLGHATVGITLDLYSHVLPSLQNEAAVAIDDVLLGGNQ